MERRKLVRPRGAIKLDPLVNRNLTLSEDAFISLVTSCVEVYKKESFGLLLGIMHRKHYMVIDTINYQSAKRGYVEVSVTANKVKRMNYVLKRVTDLRVIGDFHSHPDGPEYLSETDYDEIAKSGTPLSVLVVVKKTRKRRKWEVHKDLSVSGNIGSKFFVKILAFEFDGREIYPIKIICPYIKELNKLGKLVHAKYSEIQKPKKRPKKKTGTKKTKVKSKKKKIVKKTTKSRKTKK
jgi:proteasome lid subunit RPN8/RPN11